MTKLNKKDLWKIFYWSNWFTTLCNYEKFESAGFTLALFPAFDKLYPNDEDKLEAYTRHQEFFLTECQCARTVIGVTAALEERYANEKDIPVEMIQGIKAAMMGPLAGIGDTIYHGTLRPIFATIAVSLVEASKYTSAAGPIMFFLVMGAIGQLINWVGIFKGYEKGVEFLEQVDGSNLIDTIREYASIAGCIIMGGFSCGLVNIRLGIQFNLSDSVISLQNTLDGLIPYLIPVSYTLLMYYFITKKEAKPITLMLATICMGTIGYLLGIFA